mgnify:CR=1 FL=1
MGLSNTGWFGGATDVLYWVMGVLAAAAAGIGLFFYLLQNQVFGPAARAKQRAKLAGNFQNAVQVIAENGIWLQIKYDGATGWVVGGQVER